MLIPLQRPSKNFESLLWPLITIPHRLPYSLPSLWCLYLILVGPSHERLMVTAHMPSIHVRVGAGVTLDPIVGQESCVSGTGQVLAEDINASS